MIITIATVGASFILHLFMFDGIETTIQIWDTGGQERYRSLGPIYYRDGSCAIAVFDLTSQQSFQELKLYISQFQQHSIDYLHIAIVGNKYDRYLTEGGVKIDDIEQWAMSKGFSFYKTSALTGEGVSNMFNSVADLIIQKSNSSNKNVLNLEEKKDDEQNCC